MRLFDRDLQEHGRYREKTYQEFLLTYAAIEDKKREVIVKIIEAQKALVVCIVFSDPCSHNQLSHRHSCCCASGAVCQKTSGNNTTCPGSRRWSTRGHETDQAVMSRYAAVL